MIVLFVSINSIQFRYFSTFHYNVKFSRLYDYKQLSENNLNNTNSQSYMDETAMWFDATTNIKTSLDVL